MTTTYATWSADVLARYPELNDHLGAFISDPGSRAAVCNSRFIYPAERELEGRLGAQYTTPFSSNNLTVADLVIDMAAVRAFSLDGSKRAEGIASAVESRIVRLQQGMEQMLTNSGPLPSDGQLAWSNTMQYQPAFGLLPSADQWVDSAELYDEELSRGLY